MPSPPVDSSSRTQSKYKETGSGKEAQQNAESVTFTLYLKRTGFHRMTIVATLLEYLIVGVVEQQASPNRVMQPLTICTKLPLPSRANISCWRLSCLPASMCVHRIQNTVGRLKQSQPKK